MSKEVLSTPTKDKENKDKKEAPQSPLPSLAPHSKLSLKLTTDSKSFSDPAKKHLLQNEWTLWYDSRMEGNKGRPATAATWGAAVREVLTFGSVEDFWGLFNNLVEPSRLAVRSNYHLFKKGIRPAWEDEANVKGGSWVVEFQPRSDPELFNKAWLYTVLAMVGESFDDSDDIAGAGASLRKPGNRLSLWTKTAANKEMCLRIGSQWKKMIDFKGTLKYQSHEESLKGRSYSTAATSYEL